MPKMPDEVEELLHPEGGGTYLVALTSRAPAVVPLTELVDEDDIPIRIEPKVETWGKDDPEEGLSGVEVVTDLTIKAQVEADGLGEAASKGGDACYRVLLLLSLLSNTAYGHHSVKGVLDITDNRRRRGLMALGPFVDLYGVRQLTEADIRTAFGAFDKACKAGEGAHVLDSAAQYVRGLNEGNNPAEFLCYYLANEKLDPLLKTRGRDRRERDDWKSKDVQEVRNAFVHAITKGSGIEKGDYRIADSGPRIAKRARNLILELIDAEPPSEYAEIDKNQPVQPTILAYIDDPQGAYSGGWAIPSLPSRVAIKGVDASGISRLDLEGFTYDGLPGTGFEIVSTAFQTGGRFIQPMEPVGGSRL